MPQISIRPASNPDIPEILDMVGELAEFEHARGKAIATVADFDAALFGNNPSRAMA